jgi:hypothetical protein
VAPQIALLITAQPGKSTENLRLFKDEVMH